MKRIISQLTTVTLLTFPFFPVFSHAEPEMAAAEHLSAAFERVADILGPSVVTVSSVTKVKAPRRNGRQDPFFDPYKEFFGDDFFDRMFPEGKGDGNGQQGMGTGVIVDSEGHILTNNHVVSGADEVIVRLNDEKSFKAKVIGSDPRTDLAVLQIKAKGLTPATLGDSDKLRIGEWVVASGNPFGLTNSITSGIVSAKGRSFMGGSQFEDFIQTDAAINPGNSGGPLVNLKGEVVGINTAIFSKSGGYMGIGFAIPINMAKTVFSSLVKEGRVVRGWLGVGIQPVTDQASSSFGYSGTEGALVGHVESGGPADKAGIRQGDIIVALSGKRVANVNALRNTIAGTPPGQTIEVELFRDGSSKTVKAKVGELKGSKEKEDSSEEGENRSAEDIGISVEPLNEKIAQQLGSKRDKGVVISKIHPGSLGEESGLQRGDIVVSVNGKKIRSLKDFEEALRSGELKKGVRFVVETQGMERFVFLRKEE